MNLFVVSDSFRLDFWHNFSSSTKPDKQDTRNSGFGSKLESESDSESSSKSSSRDTVIALVAILHVFLGLDLSGNLNGADWLKNVHVTREKLLVTSFLADGSTIIRSPEFTQCVSTKI
jgi:hypothetical protein